MTIGSWAATRSSDLMRRVGMGLSGQTTVATTRSYSQPIPPSGVRNRSTRSTRAWSSQTAVRRDRRAVVGLEVLPERHRVGQALGAQQLLAPLEVGHPVPEQLAHVREVAPQRRGLGSGRRRCHERLHGGEQLPDEPGRGPRDQRDPAARPADSDQLVGGLLVVRCEHHADARGDGVEAVVLEGQVLGVAHVPLEVHSGRLGVGAALVEQLRREVARDHVRAGSGSRDRDVAGTRGDVEHVVARPQVCGLDEHRAQVRDDLRGDGVVVAERPHRPMARLQGGVGVGGVGVVLRGGQGSPSVGLSLDPRR